MLQDIGAGRLDISYRHLSPTGDGVALCFDGRRLLCALDDGGGGGPVAAAGGAVATGGVAGGGLRLPRWRELGADPGQATYLFSLDGEPCFLVAPGQVAPPPGYGFQDAMLLRRSGPKHLAFAGLTALHLSEWYGLNRICGRCGAAMGHDHVERMMLCPECHNAVYPKIAPVVIVGVHRGDELLLTRYAGRPQGGYALVAGYIEIGETPEDAVRREVAEEVGLAVRHPRYYKSQPWGLSGSLLLGFFAELDGPGEVTLDERELSEAVWLQRKAIDVSPDDFSLTNEMITRFKEGAV